MNLRIIPQARMHVDEKPVQNTYISDPIRTLVSSIFFGKKGRKLSVQYDACHYIFKILTDANRSSICIFKLLHFEIPDFAVSTQFMYMIIYGGIDVCTSVFKIKFTSISSSEFSS